MLASSSVNTGLQGQIHVGFGVVDCFWHECPQCEAEKARLSGSTRRQLMFFEQETFWTLLHDKSHWEFRFFRWCCSTVWWVRSYGLFLKKHWYHHLERDKEEAVKDEKRQNGSVPAPETEKVVTVYLKDVLPLELLLSHLANGVIRRQSHPKFPELYVYNYTEQAAFDRVWDAASNVCRGLINTN